MVHIEIEMTYSPSITIETLEAIAHEKFSKYEIARIEPLIQNYVKITKDGLIIANVFVKHNERKDLTTIVIDQDYVRPKGFGKAIRTGFIRSLGYNKMNRGDFYEEIEIGIRESLRLF